MEANANESDGIPNELKERLGNFDSALSTLEATLQPLLSTPHADLVEKLGPLDAAKLDLVGIYSINSLFWMYLNVCGVNPKEHAVKNELERIRSYMTRIKEAQDSINKPKLDKAAAKRFVKSALWQQAQKKYSENPAEGASTSQDGPENDDSGSSGKRKKLKK